MTCAQLNDTLIEYLGGQADPATRREVETHLASCETCRADVERMDTVWRELGRWNVAALPADARDRFARWLDDATRELNATPPPHKEPSFVWRIAAAAALVCLGAVLGVAGDRVFTRAGGELPQSVAHEGKNQYVLLLYDPVDAFERTDADERAAVEEYKAWARDLAARGSLSGGEKLTDERWVIPSSGKPTADNPAIPAGMRLGGYFVIVAATDGEARSIAETCPHRRRGGAMELRKIDPV